MFQLGGGFLGPLGFEKRFAKPGNKNKVEGEKEEGIRMYKLPILKTGNAEYRIGNIVNNIVITA